MLASTGHQTERSSTPCFSHSLQTAVRSEQSGTSPEAHEAPVRLQNKKCAYCISASVQSAAAP